MSGRSHLLWVTSPIPAWRSGASEGDFDLGCPQPPVRGGMKNVAGAIHPGASALDEPLLRYVEAGLKSAKLREVSAGGGDCHMAQISVNGALP